MRRLAPYLPAAVAALWLAWSAAAAERQYAVAVVMAASAQQVAVTPDELAQIYRRKKLLWDDGHKIEPVNLPPDSPLRRDFTRQALKMEPEELEAFWNQQYFHGIFPPYVLSSEEAVLRFIADTPGAIGYISHCSADARVKTVLLLPAANAPACNR